MYKPHLCISRTPDFKHDFGKKIRSPKSTFVSEKKLVVCSQMLAIIKLLSNNRGSKLPAVILAIFCYCFGFLNIVISFKTFFRDSVSASLFNGGCRTPVHSYLWWFGHFWRLHVVRYTEDHTTSWDIPCVCREAIWPHQCVSALSKILTVCVYTKCTNGGLIKNFLSKC